MLTKFLDPPSVDGEKTLSKGDACASRSHTSADVVDPLLAAKEKVSELLKQLHKGQRHVFFNTGKGQDGYFDLGHLLLQVDCNHILESMISGFVTSLFLFTNTPSHQK